MKIVVRILVLLMISFSAYSQQQQPSLYNPPSPYERYSYYTATVRGGLALPMATFSSGYIDQSTIQSYSIGIDWIMQRPISIGVEVGKTFFSQKLPRAIYTINDQDVSAVQTRTASLMPIQGVISYYFASPNATIRPYVQAAAGVDLLNYSLYYGSLANQSQAVKLSYGGAIGSKFLFKKDGSIGADARIKYNQTPLNYDYVTNGISQLNLTVGLFYRWW